MMVCGNYYRVLLAVSFYLLKQDAVRVMESEQPRVSVAASKTTQPA